MEDLLVVLDLQGHQVAQELQEVLGLLVLVVHLALAVVLALAVLRGLAVHLVQVVPPVKTETLAALLLSTTSKPKLEHPIPEVEI